MRLFSFGYGSSAVAAKSENSCLLLNSNLLFSADSLELHSSFFKLHSRDRKRSRVLPEVCVVLTQVGSNSLLNLGDRENCFQGCPTSLCFVVSPPHRRKQLKKARKKLRKVNENVIMVL